MQPAKQKAPALGKVFGLVAALTFLSKFIGLARDAIVVPAFGPGIITDAYNYAYLLTGNVLILFGGLGGPFHQSTVAVLTPKKDTPEIGRLVFQLVAVTAIILTVITLVLWIAEPYVVQWLSSLPSQKGNAEMWHEAGMQLQIMLPLIVISGVIGILYGVSNVYHEFTWPSLSPAIASIAMIIAVIYFRDNAGLCLGVGTLIGAVLQLAAQLPATLPHMRWQMSTKPEPGTREYTAMLWPAAISTSIGQLTVYVDAFFASLVKLGSEYHGGAWTAIINSNRLVQLPLGVLLTAMLVPILPRFTQQVAEGRIDDLKAEFRRGLRILWFLSLPMAGLLFSLSKPIVALVFQHNKFTAQDTELFSVALVWLVPSIIFYVGRDLITRVFYAHKDSTTPYRVAMVAITLKGVLDYALIGPLGVGGISLATTLITIFNLSCLSWLLRRKIGSLGTSLLIKPFAIMFGASVLGAIPAYFIQEWVQSGMLTLISKFHPELDAARSVATTKISLLVSVGIASALAFAIYLAICLLFKLEEPSQVFKRLLSRGSKKGADKESSAEQEPGPSEAEVDSNRLAAESIQNENTIDESVTPNAFTQWKIEQNNANSTKRGAKIDLHSADSKIELNTEEKSGEKKSGEKSQHPDNDLNRQSED